MEAKTEFLKNLLGETTWMILSIIMPFVYAYLTATAMLLWSVAKRKPDKITGKITEFSFSYMLNDNGAYIVSTGIFILIATIALMIYAPQMDSFLAGILIGAASSKLGNLFESVSAAFSRWVKGTIKKYDPDE